MLFLMDAWENIRNFVDSGGPILYAIAFLTFVMWTLMLERFWFYRGALDNVINNVIAEWEARAERKSWNSKQIRRAMISRVNERIHTNVNLIGTLVSLCPLMGLLGTVTGMIQVFEVLAITGGSDAKSMASGVSMATIPTMAGMVAALSGVFGSTFVNRIAARESQLLEDHLTMDH